MNNAKNVLLVTNSTTEEEINLIKAAIETQEGLDIKINLVHIIPSLPTCYFNIPSTVLLAERYYEEAEQCLDTVGKSLGVEKHDQWLVTGRIKTEVMRLASKLKAHFILASSINIAELHKSLQVKNDAQTASIQSINNLVRL
jgi:hypothetical protein